MDTTGVISRPSKYARKAGPTHPGFCTQPLPCTIDSGVRSVFGRTRMILVAGATGLVGSEVCQRLIRRGERVRALVRATSSREKVEALRSSGVELFVGDLKDSQ